MLSPCSCGIDVRALLWLSRGRALGGPPLLRRLRALSRSTILLLAASVAVPTAGAEAPPWQTWGDLHRLPEIHPGHQALLRSSYCPGGCRFDRHSAGDSRYLYVDGEEGVIFEEAGAGAISRIWMTMGAGVSVPLDEEIRLRVYIDGAETPVVDLPIPALFDGSTPPFVPPLVGNRVTSSGGNFSYVPIPYRDGCRVALVGADEKRIWFQINFHRLADAEGVASFTGAEDLSALADLLSRPGRDPWPPASGSWFSGLASLDPVDEQQLMAIQGPGSVTGLKLTLDPALWPVIELRLTFDQEPAVQMALSDFFAMGRLGPMPTRSLLLGLDADGDLYSYFPMPFFDSAEIGLVASGTIAAEVAWEVRVDDRAPNPRSGLFGADLSHAEATPVGVDFPLLSLAGQGKLAGTFLELGSTGSPIRNYLEGDERTFVDRSPHPAVYGTGVEDFFNGGFYFDQGPFSMALHGAPYTELSDGGLPLTAAYRLMLTDGTTFANHIAVGLEGGPTNNVSMRVRAVTYFYRRQQPRLQLWDLLDLGSASDRERHRYQVQGPHVFEPLDALFEGEPPADAAGVGVYRPPGEASFVMRAPASAKRLRLRRRLDATFAGQRATIYVDSQPAGSFPPVDVHQDRRWHEIDVDLSPGVSRTEELVFTIAAESEPVAGSAEEIFTAFRYELWVDAESAQCTDSDDDGVCDGLDSCPGSDDNADADADGIPDGCDSCAAGLILTAQEVISAVVYESCTSITASDGFEILASGAVTFRAGTQVLLGSGFSVRKGAMLKIDLDPGLAPGSD